MTTGGKKREDVKGKRIKRAGKNTKKKFNYMIGKLMWNTEVERKQREWESEMRRGKKGARVKPNCIKKQVKIIVKK